MPDRAPVAPVQLTVHSIVVPYRSRMQRINSANIDVLSQVEQMAAASQQNSSYTHFA
jgi:hypothetical protein